MKPTIESFILIFSFNKIQKVLLFEISKFYMFQSILCIEMNDFFLFLFLLFGFFGFCHYLIYLCLSYYSRTVSFPFLILFCQPLGLCHLSFVSLRWIVASLSAGNGRCITIYMHFFFLLWFLTQSWRNFRICAAFFVILFEIIPFFFSEFSLNLFNYFLERYFTSRWRILLEILNEIWITTEIEDISEYNFEIGLITWERMTIFFVKVFDYLFWTKLDKVTSIDMDTFARSSIDDLLYFNNKLFSFIFLIFLEFECKRN